MPDTFPVQNRVKRGYVLTPLLLHCALDYATKKAQVHHRTSKLEETETFQLLVCANNVNLLVEKLEKIKKKTRLNSLEGFEATEFNKMF